MDNEQPVSENPISPNGLPEGTPKPDANPRLASIDAFRGFVLFLILTGVLRMTTVASSFADDPSFWGEFWRFLAFHWTHVPWAGCSLHDLIQPGFMFLVGAAIPFSLASRKSRAQSSTAITLHAIYRSAILIFLGVFLFSQKHERTNWIFIETLTQIGLAYLFAFLLGRGPLRVQLAALCLILAGYWAAFALYPLPGENFDWSRTGVAADWEHNAAGFAAHWNKNTNLAWAFDNWFLNLFPRPEPFTHQNGGYTTLNFIPEIATMLLGMFAGRLLRSSQSASKKFGLLILLGVVCLAAGWTLGALGVCPVVKRIWTPAWALYSGGWCFLILAGFYLLVDLARLKTLFFPLIVLGMNSIAAYLIARMRINSYFSHNLKIHIPPEWLNVFGEAYAPLLLGACVLILDGAILYWMYRKKIFLKI